MAKPQNRTIVLTILMVFCGLLVVKQYLPMIQLPTQSTVDAKLRELESLRSDLKVAKKTYADRQAQVADMQELAEPFWIATGSVSKVDQEINSEFSRITRLAQVASVSGSQKIEMGREKPGSNLQEVNLSVDFKNITMHDLAKFFHQMRSMENRNKFRWDYCKLLPDNPRSPKAVNLSVRFKIYALNEGALAFLGLSDRVVSEQPAATTSRSNGKKPSKR